MSSTSRLSELALVIQRHTCIIDEFLSSKGLLSPSFDLDTALNLPDAVLESRNAILQATDELSALVQGPLPFLMNMVIKQVGETLVDLNNKC